MALLALLNLDHRVYLLYRSLNRRYMQLEGLQMLSDTVPTRLSAVAR